MDLNTCELNNLQDAMDYFNHRVAICHWHQLIGIKNPEPTVSALKELIGVGRGRVEIVSNEVNRIIEKHRKKEKKALEQLDEEEILQKYWQLEEELNDEQWEEVITEEEQQQKIPTKKTTKTKEKRSQIKIIRRWITKYGIEEEIEYQ